MAAGRFCRRLLLALVAVLGLASCGLGLFGPRYEYEEELVLSLDGSATLTVNASVPALVALRGARLSVDPGAALTRDEVRLLFTGPGVEVASVALSRRSGRRFVHVRLEVDDVRALDRLPMLAWSTYRLEARDDVVEFRQEVGAPAGAAVGDVGWNGTEQVAFRMRLPSRVLYENATSDVERGNILAWEQSLAERLDGVPVSMHVTMAPETILFTTLLLFGATMAAAALAFALVIWWFARRSAAGMGQEAT